jgi:hypothetical protein
MVPACLGLGRVLGPLLDPDVWSGIGHREQRWSRDPHHRARHARRGQWATGLPDPRDPALRGRAIRATVAGYASAPGRHRLRSDLGRVRPSRHDECRHVLPPKHPRADRARAVGQPVIATRHLTRRCSSRTHHASSTDLTLVRCVRS